MVWQLNNYTPAPFSEERVSEATGANSAAGSLGLFRRRDGPGVTRVQLRRRGSIVIVNDDGSRDAGGLHSIVHPIDPSAAIGGGFDATALLVLWLLRSAVPALLIVGVAYAWVVTETRFESIPDVTTPGQAVRVLVSPFVLVGIGIILRFLVGVAALVLAYPLSRRETGSSIGPGMPRRPFRVWADRLHLVRAYRSLRWTSSVRQVAATRLGRWGRVLSWSGPALFVTDVVMIFVLVVVVYLNPRS